MTDSFNIKSSFDTLLKLHEVISSASPSRFILTFEQKSPAVKNRLNSVMERLNRLCSSEESDDDDEHERWAKLFK